MLPTHLEEMGDVTGWLAELSLTDWWPVRVVLLVPAVALVEPVLRLAGSAGHHTHSRVG
ncbi:MAG TPA: hypothetical protein VGL80_17950 [Pseudonocardiaceae bacterium]